MIRWLTIFLLGATMTTLAETPRVSHDFDFMVGSWKVQNRYLQGRLRRSHLWIEYEARYEFELLLNGLGNIDHYHSVRESRPVEGITLRLYNPATDEWSLYWADNVRPGRLLPPMIGRFHGDVGEFYGEEEVDGKPVRCRFRWYRDSKTPRWEQAFSANGGQTWETNWIMTFTRENQS
jgi:hypothetical protein